MELTVGQWAGTRKPGPMEMCTFGQALKSDLEAIYRIEVDTYGDEAYSRVVLRQLLDVSGELFRICKDVDGDVIAYGVMVVETGGENAWLHSVAVSGPDRCKGIGGVLVGQLVDKAKSYSLRKIFLTVSPGNDAAVSLYKKLGFVVVETERDYYGRGEHRLIMRWSD